MNLKIKNKIIREYKDVFIIAEAGANHNGELSKALELVDIAVDAGADAVKFQTFKAEQVVTKFGEMASYQRKNMGKNITQLEMLKALELKEEYYPQIIKYCRKKKIMFLSTPHGGKASVDFLESLGIEVYKIGSGDLTNYILLARVAKTKKPIILSSGMATLREVKLAIDFIKSKGNKKISVLHCTSNYPCQFDEVNLLAMKTMMEEFDIPVGYSDHTEGSQAAIMAATLGAAIYEGHFTLNKKISGPDHRASASPQELKERIRLIRSTKIMLGNSKKIPTKSEISSMKLLVRKSIVAARNLNKGSIIRYQDLEAKRPASGIPPDKYQMFIGKKLRRSLNIDDQITFKDIY